MVTNYRILHNEWYGQHLSSKVDQRHGLVGGYIDYLSASVPLVTLSNRADASLTTEHSFHHSFQAGRR